MGPKKTRRTRRTRRTKGLKLAAAGVPSKDRGEAPGGGVKMYTSVPSGRTSVASDRVSQATPAIGSRRVLSDESPAPTTSSRMEIALWVIVFSSAILTVVGMRSRRPDFSVKNPVAGETAVTSRKQPGAGPGFPTSNATAAPDRPVSRAISQARIQPGAPDKTIATQAGARTGTWKAHRTVQRKKRQSNSSTFTGEPRTAVYGPPLGEVGDEVTVSGVVTASLSDGALVRVNGRSILVKGPGAADLRVGADFSGRASVVEPLGDLQAVQIEGGP